MIKVYEIKDGYLGSTKEVPEGQPIQRGWTYRKPPDLKPGEYAAWTNGWSVTTVPPMPPAPNYDPATQELVWEGQWVLKDKTEISAEEPEPQP